MKEILLFTYVIVILFAAAFKMKYLGTMTACEPKNGHRICHRMLTLGHSWEPEVTFFYDPKEK